MPRYNVGSSVFVVSTLAPRKHGSMEDQILALARRLTDAQICLTYVFRAPVAPWLSATLAKLGVLTYTFDYSRPLTAALRLYDLLRQVRPGVVHFHFVDPYSPLVAAARAAGAAILVNDHLHRTRGTGSQLRDQVKRIRSSMLHGLFDLRIAVSESVARSIADVDGLPAAKIAVVENGIDVERFSQDGSGRGAIRDELGVGTRPVIVCISRLAEEKGISSAIRMMPYLRRDAVLLLVGDGPDEGRMRRIAAELQLGDRVRFLGVRDDAERLLAATDVAIMPSHYEEAFGLAVVESMAAGRPVVVSRSGAMPSIVGEAGLVVPKRDPAQLAFAVRSLIDDPALRIRLGRAGQARARARYGMAGYVDQVCALYRQFCSSQPTRRAA